MQSNMTDKTVSACIGYPEDTRFMKDYNPLGNPGYASNTQAPTNTPNPPTETVSEGPRQNVATPSEPELRDGGICISCGKTMWVPKNQMAGMVHDKCKTKVEPTVEKWEIREKQLEDFLQAVCDGLIERLGMEPDGHGTWAVTTDQIIAEVREEILEHFHALLNKSVQEAKAEAEKITYDSVVPTWVGDEPAWTLIAIQNGEVIWESENPVTKRDIQSVYHRETGRYASTVATVEETRVAAKHFYLKSTLNTKASLKQEEGKV